MMCSPIGIPSESKPHGTLAAVKPIVLIGCVYGRKPHAGIG